VPERKISLDQEEEKKRGKVKGKGLGGKTGETANARALRRGERKRKALNLFVEARRPYNSTHGWGDQKKVATS